MSIPELSVQPRRERRRDSQREREGERERRKVEGE